MWSPPRLILNNEIANNALTDAFYSSTATTRGRRGLKGRQKSKSSGASPQKYPYDEGGEVYEFINVIETSGGGGGGYLDYYEEEDGDFLRLWSRSGSNASGLLQVPSTQTLFEEWQQNNSCSSQQRTQRSSSITVPIQRRSMEGVDRMGGMVGGGSGSLFIKRRCSSASPKRRNSNNNNVLGQLVQQPSLINQFHGELRRASQISSTLSEKRRRRRRSSGALTRRQSFAGGASGAWSSSSSSSLSSPSSPSKKPLLPTTHTTTKKSSLGGNKRSHLHYHRPSGFSSNSTNNTRSSGESGTTTKSIHRLKKPQQRPSFDVVIIGSPNVGKSSLASTFSKSYTGLGGPSSGGISSSGSDQGIGSDEEEEDEEDCHDQDLCPGKAVTYHPPGHSFTLRIFPQTTSALPHLYKYEGVILLYSVTCRDSFAFARSALRSMPPSKAVLLVANKSDLERSRVVSQLEGRSLATAYDTKFIEISSSLEIGIEALHRGLAAQISLRAKLNNNPATCPPPKNHPLNPSSSNIMNSAVPINKPTSATRAKLTALLNKLVSLKGGRGSSKSCLDLHSL